MQTFFDNEYYNEAEDEKPQFVDDDDEGKSDNMLSMKNSPNNFHKDCDFYNVGNWNWDTWMGENEEEFVKKEDYDAEESHEPNCEDPDFIVRPFLLPHKAPLQTQKPNLKMVIIH